MAKFDKNRPYGECTPIENGVAYWQNGNHFDAQFNHVSAKGEILERAEGNKAPPLKTKKVPTGVQQVEEKLPASDGEETETEGETETETETSEPGTVDLLAWAKGEVKGVQFFVVRKAMVDQGFDSPKTAAEAKDAIMARLGRMPE